MNEPVPLWRAIDGFFDYPDLYDRFVEYVPGGSWIVEVGSYLGASACYLGDRIRASGKHLPVVCVDKWPTIYIRDDGVVIDNPFDTFLANIRQAGLEGWILPIRLESAVAARLLCNDLGAVFIDAAHDYESVKQDIQAWLPKVRKGGFLAGHDYSEKGMFSGVKQAVDELLPDRELVSFQCWMKRL